MIIRFDKIHKRDVQTPRRTDGRTDTAWRHRQRMHSIARQKLSRKPFRHWSAPSVVRFMPESATRSPTAD